LYYDYGVCVYQIRTIYCKHTHGIMKEKKKPLPMKLKRISNTRVTYDSTGTAQGFCMIIVLILLNARDTRATDKYMHPRISLQPP
jgi:hypothetical protein